MKHLLLTLALTATLMVTSFAQNAPDFTWTDIDGVEHNLYETLDEGTVVVLDFFFVDCPPCQQLAPDVEDMIADYEGQSMEVWSISDRDSDSYIAGSMFNPSHSNHKAGGSAGAGAAAVNLYANNYNFTGFPTFAVICLDKSITWDIWPLSSGVPELRDELTASCGVMPLATSVSDIEGLSGANMYPNPAKDLVTVDFTLEETTSLDIEVYNALGQRVKSLGNTDYDQGQNSVQVDVADLANGVYTVRMQSAQGVQSYELVVAND